MQLGTTASASMKSRRTEMRVRFRLFRSRVSSCEAPFLVYRLHRIDFRPLGGFRGSLRPNLRRARRSPSNGQMARARMGTVAGAVGFHRVHSGKAQRFRRSTLALRRSRPWRALDAQIDTVDSRRTRHRQIGDRSELGPQESRWPGPRPALLQGGHPSDLAPSPLCSLLAVMLSAQSEGFAATADRSVLPLVRALSVRSGGRVSPASRRRQQLRMSAKEKRIE
jgi:hypothetical protein